MSETGIRDFRSIEEPFFDPEIVVLKMKQILSVKNGAYLIRCCFIQGLRYDLAPFSVPTYTECARTVDVYVSALLPGMENLGLSLIACYKRSGQYYGISKITPIP